jgi:hypothetical protein
VPRSPTNAQPTPRTRGSTRKSSSTRVRPPAYPAYAGIVRRGYKRAIIAIGHKILRTIFFILKRREHYRDCATDYEALSVQRNAPRWIKALTKFGFIAPASA